MCIVVLSYYVGIAILDNPGILTIIPMSIVLVYLYAKLIGLRDRLITFLAKMLVVIQQWLPAYTISVPGPIKELYHIFNFYLKYISILIIGAMYYHLWLHDRTRFCIWVVVGLFIGFQEYKRNQHEAAKTHNRV